MGEGVLYQCTRDPVTSCQEKGMLSVRTPLGLKYEAGGELRGRGGRASGVVPVYMRFVSSSSVNTDKVHEIQNSHIILLWRVDIIWKTDDLPAFVQTSSNGSVFHEMHILTK